MEDANGSMYANEAYGTAIIYADARKWDEIFKRKILPPDITKL